MGLLDRITARRANAAVAPDPLDPDEVGSWSWPSMRARAVAHAEAQTRAHAVSWGLSDSAWRADLERGELIFSSERCAVTAPLQVVGSLAPDDTFLWGWQHPSVPEHLANAAAALRAYGIRHDVEALTTAVVPADLQQARTFTAAAGLLVQAQGIYSGPTGQTRVFFTFGPVRVERSAGAA